MHTRFWFPSLTYFIADSCDESPLDSEPLAYLNNMPKKKKRSHALEIHASKTIDCNAPEPVRGQRQSIARTPSPRRILPSKVPPTLNAFIDQQNWFGYFFLSDLSLRLQLLRNFDYQVTGEIHRCLKKASWIVPFRNFFHNDIILDTLLTTTFIKARYAESKELWELVISKAENWLKREVNNAKLLNECWQITQKHLQSESTIEPAIAPSDVENTDTNTNTNTKSTLDGISEDLVETDVARDKALTQTPKEAESS